MKKYISVLTLSILMAVLLSECKSAKTATTKTTTTAAPMEEKKPSLSPAELADISAGHDLFTTKCSRCHDQPQPHQHDDGRMAEDDGEDGPQISPERCADCTGTQISLCI